MSRKQDILIKKHGTLDDFSKAVGECVGEISPVEAQRAVFKYERELKEAQFFAELSGDMKITYDPILAKRWRNYRKFANVGITNGCYDLLHAGHVQFLRRARQNCDYLILLLNSDKSVNRLKGAGRPVNAEMHRALVMSAVEMVDLVFVFNDTRVAKWLTFFRPNIWFKGGDYTLETLHKKEVEAARRAKCEIAILKGITGISTTKIYERTKKTLG